MAGRRPGFIYALSENEMDIINIGQFSATTGSSDDMNNAITRVLNLLIFLVMEKQILIEIIDVIH